MEPVRLEAGRPPSGQFRLVLDSEFQQRVAAVQFQLEGDVVAVVFDAISSVPSLQRAQLQTVVTSWMARQYTRFPR